MTKKGSSFDMRVVIQWGKVSIRDFCDRGRVYEGCNEDFLYLFFSFHFRYIIFCTLVLCPFSDSKPCTYVDIYIEVVITFFHLSLHMLFCFLSLCTSFLFNVCNIIFLFHTKMP